MSNELQPGAEDLTELTTVDLLFHYKQHENDFGKNSIAIALLNEAERRDAERASLRDASARWALALAQKYLMLAHKLMGEGDETL